MALGKVFIILGALLTLVGTYIFAINGVSGLVGSGIGFIFNFINLFTNAVVYASIISIEVWLFYLLLVVFAIFIISGGLQLIGIISRAIGFIFSLFPLGVGIMFVLLFYTEILEPLSSLFALFFTTGQIGNIFPILVDIGGGTGLGAFFLIGGGLFGVINTFLPRE
ncbi:MAG: hypothetical protein KGD74_04225 [Candidatus Lokiarchaeota archaeon]|nr:hypothetical protein [Candidatus Lokiarchaeota archaeon]